MKRAWLLHDRVGPDSPPDDLDVLEQVAAVESALAALGWGVEVVPCDLNLSPLAERLRSERPELCFNLVESLGGHGRLAAVVPGLLEAMGVRFTGSGSAALFTATHKTLCKRLLRSAGVATPEWFEATDLAARRETGEVLGTRVEHSGDDRRSVAGRWIVKSVWEHASRGLDEDSVIEVGGGAIGARALGDALASRRESLGGEGFVERYIEGREFNIAVLSGRVLPLAEMLFEGYAADRPRVMGYRAKWDESAPAYRDTVRRFIGAEEPTLAGAIRDVVSKCWSVFGLRGWARVDLRIDTHGVPWVIDVNANPCLSLGAGFAVAALQSGLTFDDAIARIVEDAG
ncbi:MAG: D-alanine--D-alanine ligase [Phycisphaerales bacterium]